MNNMHERLLHQMERGNIEETESGVLFPTLGVVSRGEFLVSSTGYEDSVESNTTTHEGLNYLLECGLNGAAALPNFYVALFGNAYTPTAALTAAQFPATAGEITSSVEGYQENTRQAWQPGAAETGSMDNTTNLCSFTITTGSSVVIRGAALLSEAVRGSTAGKLIAAARFGQERTQYNGDVFTTGYRITLTPA